MENSIHFPTLRDALRVWLKIGLLSFGGPAGQIALMHRILVDEKKWISEARFLNGLNFCMLLPGPEAMQLATYVGWLMHGTVGGIVAGVLFILPGFFVILGLSTIYALFQGTAWFVSLFFGLKAAVLAVVIEALLRVSRKALKSNAAYWIAAAAFIALFVFHVPFPLVILAAGGVGAWLKLAPAASGQEENPLSPPTGNIVRTLAIWGGLWGLPLAILLASGQESGLWMTLSIFFSKMAVVTFGGAYAVLAYVAQAAVEQFGWLKPTQMIDGLALAETTPGPLILVLTFVGFQAGFQNPGGLSPLFAGVLGASLTTWVTFIPCFLWIFLGAPYIERLRQNRRLASALAGITAAVVGVILNLSLWFALNFLFSAEKTYSVADVGWRGPDLGSLDLFALGLSLIAILALFRFKIGMVPTLALCAVLGAGLKMITG